MTQIYATAVCHSRKTWESNETHSRLEAVETGAPLSTHWPLSVLRTSRLLALNHDLPFFPFLFSASLIPFTALRLIPFVFLSLILKPADIIWRKLSARRVCVCVCEEQNAAGPILGVWLPVILCSLNKVQTNRVSNNVRFQALFSPTTANLSYSPHVETKELVMLMPKNELRQSGDSLIARKLMGKLFQ